MVNNLFCEHESGYVKDNISGHKPLFVKTGESACAGYADGVAVIEVRGIQDYYNTSRIIEAHVFHSDIQAVQWIL